MKPKTYFLLITFLALGLSKISYSQYKDVPFALSPFIGDTLNLNERNYYGLYQDFNGFQRAVYSVSEDGATLLTRISYSRDGEVKDTVIKQNADYKGNLLALIRRVDVERLKNWKDARAILLTDVNGYKYSGSFFDLEKNRLYMTTTDLPDYSQVINNYRIFNKEDIKSVFVKGKSHNIGSNVGYGFLIGAGIGALIGFAGGDDQSGFLRMTAGAKALVGGIVVGAIGAIIGLLSSFSASTSDEMISINSDEDFYGLVKFLKSARIYTQISQINQ